MAVTFTTNAQYLRELAASTPPPLPATGTIMFKLKPAGWGAGSSTTRCLFCQSSASGQLCQITSTGGIWYCGWSDSGHVTITVANIGLVANIWNTFVLRWNSVSGAQTVYTNGVLRGTDSSPAVSPGNTAGIERRWGAHTVAYGTAVVEGDMADCAIVNGEITTAEIAAFQTLPPDRAVTSAALLQHFSLNASTISGATVDAETGINGTLAGSPPVVDGPLYARSIYRSRLSRDYRSR